MPVDNLAIGSIAGQSVPSTKDMFNNFSTLATNYLNQRFSEKMYNRQRKDALEFWNMQNAYNDPSAQMDRLRNAGLNPHLVYGNGGGNSNAGPIPTPDAQSVNFREPRIEGNNSILPDLLGAADIEIKNAQADNLRAQNEEIRQTTLLKSLQAQRAGFDLEFEKKLSEISADYRRELLRKLKIESQATINRDAREAAMTSSNLTEALERVLNMREQRENIKADRGRTFAETSRTRAETARLRETLTIMKKEGTLKDIEIKLREAGVNPNDPMWQRYLGLMIQGIMDKGADFMNSLPSSDAKGGVNYRPDFGPKY